MQIFHAATMFKDGGQLQSIIQFLEKYMTKKHLPKALVQQELKKAFKSMFMYSLRKYIMLRPFFKMEVNFRAPFNIWHAQKSVYRRIYI
jgi:hypothetical protein